MGAEREEQRDDGEKEVEAARAFPSISSEFCRPASGCGQFATVVGSNFLRLLL